MLKEKLKAVKARLKFWDKEQFGDTQKKIQRIERELNKLEIEGDERQLSDDELLTQKKLQEELWIAAQSRESLLRQKARSRWIKKGD